MSVMSIDLKVFWPAVCLSVLLLAGCAASGGSNASVLLDQDYQKMTNAQLTAYEQQLSDEIASSSGSSGSGLSIGLGFGSWGSHTGGGVGVNQNLGGGGAPVELRDRREAVRVEMRKRGLLPPVAGGG